MTFVSIRTYKAKDQKLDAETIKKVETGFAPIIKNVPGFQAYRLIDSGNYSVSSVSVYDTEESANESNEKSREWVAENLAHLIDGPATVFNGEVIFSQMA
jgi:heme-degrading monooxygenase HmoA